MNRDNARMAVYALGGAYLLYLAWQLYSGLETAGSEKPLMIVFAVLFALVGSGAVILGLYSGWKQAKKLQEAAEPEEVSEQVSSEEVSEEEQEADVLETSAEGQETRPETAPKEEGGY